MEPQVFFSVCYDDKNPPAHIRERHTFSPAILHGYCRRRIQHADYPGMVEDPEHTVRGTVVSGITKVNLDRLDHFEGSPYDRRVVRPRLLLKAGDEATGEGNVEGEQIVTESYIYLNTHDLEDKEWDFAEFKRDKMQKWTRAGYVFEGKSGRDMVVVCHTRVLVPAPLLVDYEVVFLHETDGQGTRLRPQRYCECVRGCLDTHCFGKGLGLLDACYRRWRNGCGRSRRRASFATVEMHCRSPVQALVCWHSSFHPMR